MQTNSTRKLSIDFLLNESPSSSTVTVEPQHNLEELADIASSKLDIAPKRKKMLSTTTNSFAYSSMPYPAVFLSLRMQAYCYMMNKAISNNESRFVCPFDPSCVKTVKGKGNLRRHIEWHLQKLEEDFKELVNTMKENKL